MLPSFFIVVYPYYQVQAEKTNRNLKKNINFARNCKKQINNFQKKNI